MIFTIHLFTASSAQWLTAGASLHLKNAVCFLHGSASLQTWVAHEAQRLGAMNSSHLRTSARPVSTQSMTASPVRPKSRIARHDATLPASSAIGVTLDAMFLLADESTIDAQTSEVG